MSCSIPANVTWREKVPNMDDIALAANLRRAWDNVTDPFSGMCKVPDGSQAYHDWTHYRAITLREARKRGLDLSVTGR